MYYKPILLLIILTFCLVIASGQSIPPVHKVKHVVYLESLGHGGYGSVNYESMLSIHPKIKLAMRIGLGTYHLRDYTNTFNPDLIFPLALNAVYGIKHHIEIGLGETISSIVYANQTDFKPTRKHQINSSFLIGYRYQKKRGLMIRVAYTPIIEKEKYFRNWAGLAIGYAF